MILLLRHGETFWNRERRIQGHSESELTALGHAQAQALGALVADLVTADPGPWRLVASPLGRAVRTAEAVARATGLDLETDDRLKEVHCGVWEGRLREEVAREHPEPFASPTWFFAGPGAESFDALASRARGWLGGLAPEPERRVIAVSHGVWGRVLRGLYAGLDPTRTMSLDIPQDALFRLAGGAIERVEARGG